MHSNVRYSTVSEVFDDGQIAASSGLHPTMALAQRAGLKTAVDQHLRVQGVGKANPAAKVATLIAGLCTGADTIDGVDVLRTGATGRLFSSIYAPSTLGTFLRSMTEENFSQWDSVAADFVTGLAGVAPLLTPARRGTARTGPGRDLFMVDIDDTVLPVRSHNKEHVGHTYQRCQGLSVHYVTGSQAGSRPVILTQQLRPGDASGKPGGASELVTAALATTQAAFGRTGSQVLLRGDSAYYSSRLVAGVIAAGGHVSVGVKQYSNITTAIAAVPDDAWTGIDYPNAVYDPATATWQSDAQVAEIPYTAFASYTHPADRRNIPGRLIIRRVLIDHKPTTTTDDDLQLPLPETLMPVYRYHPIFTTLPADEYSTAEAEQIHRGHAIIEQVNADLKASTLAHLPAASFAANTAWVHLAAMTYNLLHAAAALTTTLVNATSTSIRTKLINVPARLTRTARHTTLHLPRHWPWATARQQLSAALHSPPPAIHR